MIDRNKPYFPIQTETVMHPSQDIARSASVGGLTIREELTVRFHAALLSNPVYPANHIPITKIRQIAVEEAEAILRMLDARAEVLEAEAREGMN